MERICLGFGWFFFFLFFCSLQWLRQLYSLHQDMRQPVVVTPWRSINVCESPKAETDIDSNKMLQDRHAYKTGNASCWLEGSLVSVAITRGKIKHPAEVTFASSQTSLSPSRYSDTILGWVNPWLLSWELPCHPSLTRCALWCFKSSCKGRGGWEVWALKLLAVSLYALLNCRGFKANLALNHFSLVIKFLRAKTDSAGVLERGALLSGAFKVLPHNCVLLNHTYAGETRLVWGIHLSISKVCMDNSYPFSSWSPPHQLPDILKKPSKMYIAMAVLLDLSKRPHI